MISICCTVLLIVFLLLVMIISLRVLYLIGKAEQAMDEYEKEMDDTVYDCLCPVCGGGGIIRTRSKIDGRNVYGVEQCLKCNGEGRLKREAKPD